MALFCFTQFLKLGPSRKDGRPASENCMQEMLLAAQQILFMFFSTGFYTLQSSLSKINHRLI